VQYYRSDVYGAHNLQPAKTWDELVNVSQALTGDGHYGLVVPGQGDPAQRTFSDFLWQAGGDWVDEKNMPAFNSAEGIQALTFYRDLIHKYKVVPSDAVTYQWTENTSEFASGAVFDTFNWPSTYAILSNPDTSKVVGKWATAPYVRNKTATSCAVAHAMALNSLSKKKDAAIEFIKHVVSGDSQMLAFQQFTYFPSRQAVAQNVISSAQGQQAAWLGQLQKTIANGKEWPKLPGFSKVCTLMWGDRAGVEQPDVAHGFAQPGGRKKRCRRCSRLGPTTSMAIAVRPHAGPRWRRSPLTAWQQGYLLAGPALLVMIAIFVYPLGYSFVMSFFRWDLSAGPSTFLGLANYIDTLTSPEFKQSLRNQIIFSAVSLTTEVVAGMAIALLINSKLRGLRLARTLLLIPPMIAPAVVGLNFRWLFNTQYGLFDALLRNVGLPVIPWLSDPNWALVAVIIADVWQNTPLLVLLFLAGLQSVPQEPLEAAAVDGASAWRTFWEIILPLLRPVIFVALMLRIIDTFRTFDVVWLMTQGGPGGATNLITVEAYLLAFQSVDFSHAAAVSYIALIISLIFGGPLRRSPCRAPGTASTRMAISLIRKSIGVVRWVLARLKNG
jgi:multiple sugar transport system permease protein